MEGLIKCPFASTLFVAFVVAIVDLLYNDFLGFKWGRKWFLSPPIWKTNIDINQKFLPLLSTFLLVSKAYNASTVNTHLKCTVYQCLFSTQITTTQKPNCNWIPFYETIETFFLRDCGLDLTGSLWFSQPTAFMPQTYIPDTLIRSAWPDPEWSLWGKL